MARMLLDIFDRLMLLFVLFLPFHIFQFGQAWANGVDSDAVLAEDHSLQISTGYELSLSALESRAKSHSTFDMRSYEFTVPVHGEFALTNKMEIQWEVSLTSMSEREGNQERADADLISLDVLSFSWNLPQRESSDAELFNDDSTGNQIMFGLSDYSDLSGRWWDDSLLGIQLDFSTEKTAFNLLAATHPVDISSKRLRLDAEEEDQYWVLSRIAHRISEATIATLTLGALRDRSSGYSEDRILTEHDEDEIDADLDWLGAQLQYQFDPVLPGEMTLTASAALLRGQRTITEFAEEPEAENVDSSVAAVSDSNAESISRLLVDDVYSQNVSAWGLFFRFDWLLANELIVSLGYARGSGTKSQDDSNSSKTFQQTGIHSNELELGEITFDQYGSIADPQLSNLSVFSLLFSKPITRDTAIGFQLHKYERLFATDDTDALDIDLEAQSHGKDLGWEAGALLSFKEREDVELKARLSFFEPGSAFDRSHAKTLTEVDFSLTKMF